MKEHTMWTLWYFIVAALPLLVSTIAIKDLLGVREGADSRPRTKR